MIPPSRARRLFSSSTTDRSPVLEMYETPVTSRIQNGASLSSACAAASNCSAPKPSRRPFIVTRGTLSETEIRTSIGRIAGCDGLGPAAAHLGFVRILRPFTSSGRRDSGIGLAPHDMTNTPKTVAISRQRGSGGSYIGRTLADRLGLRYID